jgi:hypothetical protein
MRQLRQFIRWGFLPLLIFGCLKAQAVAVVRERDWTVQTAWGPVGVYKLSYTDPADSLTGRQAGYVQLCGGPLGRFALNLEVGKSGAQARSVAPVLLAITVFGLIAWTYRRKTEVPD